MSLHTPACLLFLFTLSAAEGYLPQVLEDAKPAGNAVSLLGASEEAALTPWRGLRQGSKTLSTIDGQPFRHVMTLQTAEPCKSYFDDGATLHLPSPVAKEDLIYITFQARSLASSLESGEAVAYLVVKPAKAKGAGELRKYFAVGRDWQRFDYAFRTSAAYAADHLQIHLWTGDQVQTMQIGGLAVLNLGPSGDQQKLPQMRLSLDYDGRAADAAWRTEADERIARLRQGPLDVRVVDADGRPVSGAQVQVEQTKHAFHFGMTVEGQRLAHEPAYRDRIARLVPELGLTSIVFNNDLKPVMWRGGEGFSAEHTLTALRWVKEHNLRFRGHTLLWGPRYLDREQRLMLKEEDREGLQRALLAHIADCAGRTAPYIDAWDVYNEHYTYPHLTQLLGEHAAAEWFRAVHQANPQAMLFWNENCILSNAPQQPMKIADALEWVARLRTLGAPLHAIGCQSHMGMTATPPTELWQRLDRFHALGVAIEATEFDVVISDATSEQQVDFQRDYVRDFMTALFAHPAVIGINYWRPLADTASPPSAALVGKDDQLLPSGESWVDLVRKRWWTHAAVITDSEGRASIRGYRGEHIVSVTVDGRRTQAAAVISSDATEVTIQLP